MANAVFLPLCDLPDTIVRRPLWSSPRMARRLANRRLSGVGRRRNCPHDADSVGFRGSIGPGGIGPLGLRLCSPRSGQPIHGSRADIPRPGIGLLRLDGVDRAALTASQGHGIDVASTADDRLSDSPRRQRRRVGPVRSIFCSGDLCQSGRCRLRATTGTAARHRRPQAG